MRHCLLIILFSSVTGLAAQNFVDTVYTIQTIENVHYGTAVNFAGVDKDLHMDISFPTNDEPSVCGRPLAIIIHGGAFAAGSKNDAGIARMRRDFAKRGYVAAAINYRLGYFHTDISKNCNIPNWNCFNIADTTEWVRAWYRGVQDAKGALRYLINEQDVYNIDAANVFVFGESAGAYISLGVAFLDTEDEKPADCGQMPDAKAPHQNYYAPCIQNTTFDIPISSMNLSRPDLGSINGSLNPTDKNYIIKGAGSFYGGAFYDMFSSFSYTNAPKLYLFHQPNDLIVPYDYDRILKGFNTCAMSTNCVSLQHRPYTYGGNGVQNMINDLSIPTADKPEVLFENTNNNADCLMQVANPSTGGHQFDSYWNRTSNMAAFFAQSIGEEDCLLLSTESPKPLAYKLYPNPAGSKINLEMPFNRAEVRVYSISGVQKGIYTLENGYLKIPLEKLPSGMYFIEVKHASGLETFKFQKVGE
ncbi:MAG: T9SS C-terminal target domain-containing protein [Chitinophagaceae bacterium]|nr:MAG: T9SS C-terminal target domain-containing protein [Chitinophagaceae bacterium]